MRIRHSIDFGVRVLGCALVVMYMAALVGIEGAWAQSVSTARETAAVTKVSSALSSSSQVVTIPPAIDQSLWSKQRIAAFSKSMLRPGAPEGVLRIPSLDLEVPVYPTSDELDLNRGAGHIEGTAALTGPGNTGIAGHRDGFFRKLKDLEINRDVFIDVAGRSLRYRVVEISVVRPEDVQVLANTPVSSVTLVTCYPFYFVGAAPKRYIARAELADVSAFDSSMSLYR